VSDFAAQVSSLRLIWEGRAELALLWPDEGAWVGVVVVGCW